MAHKWTKEQRAELSAKMKLRHAQRKTKQTRGRRAIGGPFHDNDYAKLVRLTAQLIRMLPDEKLIEMVS